MTELFKIFKVGADEANQISAMPDEPHLHHFEELIIGIDGQLVHFIDFEETSLQAPLVSFVSKGKIHRVIPKLKDGKCNMWVIRFKSEFLPEITFQLYKTYHKNAMLKLPNDYCFKRIGRLCEMIQEEASQNQKDLSVVKHLLLALFMMIETERRKSVLNHEKSNGEQNTTLQNFLQILEENYKRPLGVDFYAEKLFMSSRNLNLICKEILNQTVTELIETRKLIEAKNQLTNTSKNISEIGFDLGFKEKTYFTNVFKKRTGQTPSEFRAEMKSILS